MRPVCARPFESYSEPQCTTTTDSCHGLLTGLAGLAHGEVTQGYKAGQSHAERVARGQGEPDPG